MAEYRSDTPEHTTIIERGGSSAGTILIAFVLLLAVAVGGYYLYSTQNSEAAKDNAVAGAASSVSDAAQKVGDAVTGDQQK